MKKGRPRSNRMQTAMAMRETDKWSKFNMIRRSNRSTPMSFFKKMRSKMKKTKREEELRRITTSINKTNMINLLQILLRSKIRMLRWRTK